MVSHILQLGSLWWMPGSIQVNDAIKSKNPPIKLILVGDACVGKSSVLMRLCHDTFSSTYITTIGIDFRIRQVKLKKGYYPLQVWDTAGQERFRSIATSYYRGADGIILCYDLTRRTSFENMKKWQEDIVKKGDPGQPVIVVANKVDMAHKREVTGEEGEKFAKKHGYLFCETSCRMANRDAIIEDVFCPIGEASLEYQLSKRPRTKLVRKRNSLCSGDCSIM